MANLAADFFLSHPHFNDIINLYIHTAFICHIFCSKKPSVVVSSYVYFTLNYFRNNNVFEFHLNKMSWTGKASVLYHVIIALERSSIRPTTKKKNYNNLGGF